MPTRSFASYVLVVVVTLLPPFAHADDGTDEAKAHFSRGVALFNDNNFNAALAEFETSFRARPASIVKYNIGVTQKALFRYPDAIDTFEEYLANDKKMTAERRAEVTALVAEMKALLAELTLTVTPAGAVVDVDGHSVGAAPFARALRVPTGMHSIDVSADGFRATRKELLVAGGQNVTLEIALQELPKTGRVQLTVRPQNAIVRLDDKPFGHGVIDADVAVGGHTLEVSAPGYVTQRTELGVAVGQRREVSIELQPFHRAAFYKHWYFWVPVAVIAAAAVGVGLGAGLSHTDGPVTDTVATTPLSLRVR